MFDLIIRGGNVIDGDGGAGFTADVGIRDGIITKIGRITDAGCRTIDADGLMVTPGFIDLHTHYDGQALWDDLLNPSFENGVTTAFLGNCGVGFAPVRDGMQDKLIDLMDGVEEIPASVLSEGLAWNWNSLPEYLDQLDQAPHSFKLGAIATHGPLRLYVMGEKVERQLAADPNEIAEMANLLDEAMRAGAWGLSSSRTPVHSSRSGKMTPDFEADFTELQALAEVIGRYRGIFEFAPMGSVGENLNGLRRDMEFYERLAIETETAVHLLVSQTGAYHDFWREQLTALDRVAKRGGRMFGQVNGRGVGVMLGLLNTNPFETRETYLKVMELPVDQRMAAFRQPEVRARILAEVDNWGPRREIVGTLVNHAFEFAGLNYEPPPEAR
jgi:N-acyl-D-aspartate/D-glutamate deacylase